jgi:[acyl-carrier-protein] S-malonyltransferase
MYEQGLARPGAMAAILGTLSTPIDALCRRASDERGLVVPANYNSDEQVVISGEVAGVERAMELARDAGAKRCLPLPVSGAFHSPLMAPAASGLEVTLRGIALREPSFPVYANVHAEPVRTASVATALLVEQLTAPVRWSAIVRRLAADFPNATCIELGTGNVLTGLVRRLAPSLTVRTCGTVSEIEQVRTTEFT